MSYWHRTGPRTFTPTEHVGGAWDLDTQHIATLLVVLAHEVERDRDILGTVPLEPVDLEVTVLRAGRTIELVEARACHGGRPVVLLRAWLTAGYPTAELEGTRQTADAGTGRGAGLGHDRAVGRGLHRLGRGAPRRPRPGAGAVLGTYGTPLVADEEVSRLAQVAGLLDITNGAAVRVDPKVVSFPNLDLTAHLFRAPAPGWLGLDTRVSFGPEGAGVTTSVLHDEQGAFGVSTQCLTVRP